MRRAALLATTAILAACTTKDPPAASSPPRPATPASGAAAPAAPAAAVDEAPFKKEVRFTSEGKSLVGWLLKPSGKGPFPAVVYNHGSEQDPSLDWMGDTAEYFRAHGYVAFFPFRRGSGGSEGTYWKTTVDARPEAERPRAAIDALDAENADVAAAVGYVRGEPYVDGRRIAVAGCSFGGIHTLLAAEKDLGLWAAVDFAGASMSWEDSPLLRDRLTAAVRAAKAPIFFLQAQNDFNTTPTRVLSETATAAGKPNRAEIYPPHGKTPMQGHAGFCNHGQEEWGPDVLAFLANPPTK